MVLRIAAAIWAAFARSGTTDFWAIAVAGGLALLVLLLLWINRANLFLATTWVSPRLPRRPDMRLGGPPDRRSPQSFA
jgi:hypothetical protein